MTAGLNFTTLSIPPKKSLEGASPSHLTTEIQGRGTVVVVSRGPPLIRRGLLSDVPPGEGLPPGGLASPFPMEPHIFGVIVFAQNSLLACEFLLQNGANVNQSDSKGRGPLHHATILGHTGCREEQLSLSSRKDGRKMEEKEGRRERERREGGRGERKKKRERKEGGRKKGRERGREEEEKEKREREKGGREGGREEEEKRKKEKERKKEGRKRKKGGREEEEKEREKKKEGGKEDGTKEGEKKERKRKKENKEGRKEEGRGKEKERREEKRREEKRINLE
ncbi:Histone-lysine N-methyltransferase, H3 lysine-79 specific, partial [Ophiophagus hannah]